MGDNNWKLFTPTEQMAGALTGYVDPASNADLHLLSRQLVFEPGQKARAILRFSYSDGRHRLVRLTFNRLSEEMPADLADLRPSDVAKFEIFKGQSRADKEYAERTQFWMDLESGRRDRITPDQIAWVLNFTQEMTRDFLATPGAPTIFSDAYGSGLRYLLATDFIRWHRDIERQYLIAHPEKAATTKNTEGRP